MLILIEVGMRVGMVLASASILVGTWWAMDKYLAWYEKREA